MRTARWEVIHTDVDGCEYFAYTIYECELKAEIVGPPTAFEALRHLLVDQPAVRGRGATPTRPRSRRRATRTTPVRTARGTTRSSASTTSRASAAASAATPPATVCRFCGFKLDGGGRHLRGGLLVGQVPALPTAPGFHVPIEVDGTCPRSCTSDPSDTCFFDATCSAKDRGDKTGCHLGGHRNCRACGLAAAAGWLGPTATRPCPIEDFSARRGARASDPRGNTHGGGEREARVDDDGRAAGDEGHAGRRRQDK